MGCEHMGGGLLHPLHGLGEAREQPFRDAQAKLQRLAEQAPEFDARLVRRTLVRAFDAALRADRAMLARYDALVVPPGEVGTLLRTDVRRLFTDAAESLETAREKARRLPVDSGTSTFFASLEALVDESNKSQEEVLRGAFGELRPIYAPDLKEALEEEAACHGVLEP